MSGKGSPDELQGNTLRVYWAMLQDSKSSVGPRDIQRKLGFSSPNLAVYHLDKLVELGLATKNLGEYCLSDDVKVGVFKHFLKIGGYILPRQILYASLWSTLFVFLIFAFKEFNFYSLFALILGVLGLAIFWFEAWKSWSSRPH
ncbi:MAG: hypothetical protein ACM3UL_01350 [Ignavibacteria bacterium]